MSMDFSVLKHCTVVTERDPRLDDPAFQHDTPLQLDGIRKDIMYLDEQVVPNFFLNEYMWHVPGTPVEQSEVELKAAAPHVSSYDKVISFIGTNEEDLYDICGEVEILLENRRFTLTRHFAVYIPAGMCHAVTVKRVDRPMWQYVLGNANRYDSTPCEIPAEGSGRDLEKLFAYRYGVGPLPEDVTKGTGPKDQFGRHDHITRMDEDIVPDAQFYIEASWMGTAPQAPLPEGVEHAGPGTHWHPFPELINFFGADPENPYDLGTHVYLTLEDQPFDITKSFVACIPSDVPHCPLYMKKIENRMVHFTAGPSSSYIIDKREEDK